MSRLKFLTLENITNISIHYPDIYFTPEYGKACQYSDSAIWECCIYKDLIYVYLKKLKDEDKKCISYNLITPYGYSGYYFLHEETFDEFFRLFEKECIYRNYFTQIVRQNPYLNINLPKYKIIKKKHTFGVDLTLYKNFEEYINSTHKDNRRGYKIAIKKNLKYEIVEINSINLSNFRNIYHTTMNHLKSEKYYHFNDDYFEALKIMKDNIFIIHIKYGEKVIASGLIFKYGKYLHYHLGGSVIEFRNLRPNNYMHCIIVDYGIKNKFELYHLGGGLEDYDSLYNFKSKIGNKIFNYNIMENT